MRRLIQETPNDIAVLQCSGGSDERQRTMRDVRQSGMACEILKPAELSCYMRSMAARAREF